MNNLLKRFTYLNHRWFYYSAVLMIIFSLAVYPPSIGSGKTQITHWRKAEVKTISKTDSLKRAIIITDSLINSRCSLLLKQQDTIKHLIKKH